MSETGADMPMPPTEPQPGPRDVGYHPRQQAELPQAPQSLPAQEVQLPTSTTTTTDRRTGGIINKLTGVGRRIADTLSATPEPRLLPDQVNAQEVARRMMLSRDDRTKLGFTPEAQMQWMGYITEPKQDTPEYQQWLAVSQGVRKANIDLVNAGIIEQGSIKTPSGELVTAFRVKDGAKLAQLAESKPVMQAHPNNPQQGK